MGPAEVALRIAGRATVTVPRTALSVVPNPTWRDVPASGTPGYLDLTAPAEPNVLLALSTPVSARLLGGLLRRPVTTLGLHVDDPHAFAVALGYATHTAHTAHTAHTS